jgi:hypothetical protein
LAHVFDMRKENNQPSIEKLEALVVVPPYDHEDLVVLFVRNYHQAERELCHGHLHFPSNSDKKEKRVSV